MDPAELLGKTIECGCGQVHDVPTRFFVYAEDAIESIPGTLAHFVERPCAAIVSDQRTWTVAGERSRNALAANGWSTEYVIVPDAGGHGPICNEAIFESLSSRLPVADIVLAVGSGVLNDLAKWVAFERGVPYAVLATAATMNGYASANVAPAIKGVKSLLKARAPVAVFAVPSVLTDAPYELTTAGLGDAIAKPVSTADWIASNLLRGEYFCRYCSEILNTTEPLYMNHPEDIRGRKPRAMQGLFEALFYSGIAMTIIGTSAPASGGEHLLSHTLDMMSTLDGKPHDLHGRQVGLGTLFASALYERILQIEKPQCRRMPDRIDSAFWGPLAGSVSEQYEQKQPAIEIIEEKLSDRRIWRALTCAWREQVRPPQRIKDCLATAGAAHTFTDIGCTRDRLLSAVSHMHEIRKRPTVVDLAWVLGVLPTAATEIIDRWLTR